MPSNVEIKAKVRDPALLRDVVTALAGEPQVIRQTDTFFATPRGRLKLREFSPEEGELIYYQRPDAAGPKQSQYRIVQTRDPRGLCATLHAALGTVGRVRKVRRLFLVGPTRIHLDDVEDLGPFVELEVVLQPGQTAEEGVRVARDLMARLGIQDEHLVGQAYLDLLQQREPP